MQIRTKNFEFLKISQEEAESFEHTFSSYLSEEIVQYGKIGPSVMQLLESLDELASPDVCTARANKFGVKNSMLIAERPILRSNGRLMIAGLRFRKLSPEFPFVHLTPNFLLSSADLSLIREKIRSEFSFISPKGFTVRLAANLRLSMDQEKWSHTVYGKITDAPPFHSQRRFGWPGTRMSTSIRTTSENTRRS